MEFLIAKGNAARQCVPPSLFCTIDWRYFFTEMFALNRKVFKIEGIELNDSRIDKYIDYAKEAEAMGENYF